MAARSIMADARRRLTPQTEAEMAAWLNTDEANTFSFQPSDLLPDGTPKPEVLAEIEAEKAEIKRRAQADGTWMKAPNGQPSKLNEAQWVAVRTRRFKEWFGDWEAIEAQARFDSFVTKALADSQFMGAFTYRMVNTDEVSEIKRQGGPDVSGMVHELDAAHLRHVINSHSDPMLEKQRGQRAFTPADFPRLLETLDAPDAIVVTPGKVNNTKISYQKHFPDGTVMVAERAMETSSRKTPRLVFKTAWVQVSPAGVKSNTAPVYTPGRQWNHAFSNGRVNPDSVSKVVDENGEPLVVYHGTDAPADFDAFDSATARSDVLPNNALGHFFTPSPESASYFAGGGIFRQRGAPRIYPAFLSIKNPQAVDAEVFNQWNNGSPNVIPSADGLFVGDSNPSLALEIVVAAPTQIKSATANAGTYSSETGDIRYSFAPDVDNLPQPFNVTSLVTPESETFTPALHAIHHPPPSNDAADRGRAAQNRPGYPQVDFDRSGKGRRPDAPQPGAAAENRRAASLEQFLRLVSWSRSQARFDVSRLANERDRGGEHVIYNSTEGPQRLFKVTHPGQAGLTIVTHQNSQGEFNSAIGSATPAEYLERMVILNEIFFSMIQLEGFIEGDQSSIVISQPKVEGSMPEQAEITAYLRDKLGFDRVDTLIWYRPSDGLVIGDTKRSNFIKTPDGQIVPIDIAARFASPEMAESWGYPPPPPAPLRQKLEALRAPGRAQPLDAPVLTPDGWRPIGSLAIGEVLASTDGAPSTVTGIYPQGRKPVFKITLADGRTVRATEDHLWKARVNGREITMPLQTRSLACTLP